MEPHLLSLIAQGEGLQYIFCLFGICSHCNVQCKPIRFENEHDVVHSLSTQLSYILHWLGFVTVLSWLAISIG